MLTMLTEILAVGRCMFTNITEVKMKDKKATAGNVYIMYTGIGDLYKIGMSVQVRIRLKNLQSANPLVKIVWSAPVINARLTEKTLHKMFRRKKEQRELYHLTDDDIKNAMSYTEQYRIKFDERGKFSKYRPYVPTKGSYG